jgi:hypothetical protein
MRVQFVSSALGAIVLGGDGGLHQIGSGPAMTHGLVDQGQALGDHPRVPQRAILVLQQHHRPIGVEPGRGAGVLQQQQGGQAHDLRLAGEQPQQQPRQADGLSAQRAAGQQFLAAGRIALVEDQIDHGRHGVEALGPLLEAGRAERHVGRADPGLGAGDPLLHRRLADQEGAGDLPDRQARDDPQGHGHLLGGGQVRMAADEQQPQHVVAIVLAVQPVDQGGLGVLQVGDQLLGRQRGRLALLAHPVQRGVAADQDQPRGRVARRTVLGPGLQGPKAGVLKGLLGGVQVAEIAQQGRHRLGPRGGQGGVDPGRVDIGDGHAPASFMRALFTRASVRRPGR